MRAIAKAAAAVIAGAFETMELAICGAEAGLSNQRGEGGHSRIAHSGRQGALALSLIHI